MACSDSRTCRKPLLLLLCRLWCDTLRGVIGVDGTNDTGGGGNERRTAESGSSRCPCGIDATGMLSRAQNRAGEMAPE